MKILVSEQADADLLHIHSYLVERNPGVAWETANRFAAVFESLTVFPFIGRDRSSLLPGARSILAEKYAIFYRIDDEVITIIRVLDGRRDIETELRG